jgi:cytoskeletal protein RodZ
MNTIGKILKEARVEKNYSLDYVERNTKIRQSFIRSIEGEKWEDLPPFPTVLGFVKSLASAVGVDQKLAVATLRRDYPPQKLSINPKPDVGSKFSFGPRIAFMAGVFFVTLVIIGYLVFQYQRFISPPSLRLDSPKDGQEVQGRSVLVFGSTDTDVKVTVNNQPVLVNSEGKFSVNIDIVPETEEIVVKAMTRSGKETAISRKIKVQDN